MVNHALRSPARAIAALAAQQNILLSRVRPGTKVYVETTDHSYELTLLDCRSLKVEIVSDDPRLGVRTVGVFERSIYDERAKAFLSAQIVEGMRMQIRFANGVFRSRPVTAATVLGSGWHYKVF